MVAYQIAGKGNHKGLPLQVPTTPPYHYYRGYFGWSCSLKRFIFLLTQSALIINEKILVGATLVVAQIDTQHKNKKMDFIYQ